MSLILFLIILPLFVEARIRVNVTVLSNKTDINVNVSYSGNDIKVVTENELKVFNIKNERLNKGLRVELGKVPNDIYLKDPTPYGNLFHKYKWSEMKRLVTLKKAKVIDILNEETVLNTHEHINKTPNDIKSKRSMFEVIENRVSSTWSEDGLPLDDILYSNYSINFGYGILKYENNWRNGSLRAIHMPIGMSKGGSITIKPEQTVITKLRASKTILLIELMYEAKLIGSIVANYAELYGKYHFWAPSVESIMKAGNMTNNVITTEIMEIRCFTNPKLEIYDKLTGEIVEPPRKKRPRMKILRIHNITRVIYTKTKKQKKPRKKIKTPAFM